MSQYLNFYIKKPNEETYLPIGTFTRSSVIYQYGHDHAPYEKGTSINRDMIAHIKEDIANEIAGYNKEMKELLNEQADIIKMNNSVEEAQKILSTSKALRFFCYGHPTYLAGMSGIELAIEIASEFMDVSKLEEYVPTLEKSPEYWAGWALADYCWYKCKTNKNLSKNAWIYFIL